MNDSTPKAGRAKDMALARDKDEALLIRKGSKLIYR